MAKEKAEKKAAEPKKEKVAAAAKTEKTEKHPVEAKGEAKADAGHAHDHDKGDEKGHGHGKDKKHEEPTPEVHHKAWHAKSKPRAEMCCGVKNCKRRYRAKGYCVSHYREWRHGKFGKVRYTSCMANNCTKAMATSKLGLCEEHWVAVYKKGLSVTAKVAAPEKEAVKASA